MADIFDVVSDPTRRDLLVKLLGANELPVGALVEQTGLSQPTVSKHLKVLREAGLVTVREEAQHRYYRLDAGPLGELLDWLAPFVASAHPEQFADDAGNGGAPSAAYVAWSGAGVGEQLGRAAAGTRYQAQAALERLQSVTARAREYLDDARVEFAKFLSR